MSEATRCEWCADPIRDEETEVMLLGRTFCSDDCADEWYDEWETRDV